MLRGEAGVGKSALLEYLVQRATGCAVARAAGVEAEMELAFAGLQQLSAPWWIGSNASPTRSATRLARPSGCATATRRTASWSAWPC